MLPEIELPGNLPDLYRKMVDNIAETPLDEGIAGRAADERHEMADQIVVHWDAEADGHCLAIKGTLLEMIRKSAPINLDAIRQRSISWFDCRGGI